MMARVRVENQVEALSKAGAGKEGLAQLELGDFMADTISSMDISASNKSLNTESKACSDLSLTDGHDQSLLGMANVDFSSNAVTSEQVIRIIHGGGGASILFPHGSLAMFGPFGQVRMISAFTPGMLLKLGARDLWAKLVKPDALNRFFTSSFDDLLKENIHIKSHPASITVDWSMRLLYSKAFEFPASGLLSAKEILVKMRKTHLSPLSSQFHSIDYQYGSSNCDDNFPQSLPLSSRLAIPQFDSGNTGNFKNGWKREINDDPINEMEERRNNKRKKLSHQNQTIEELAEIKDFRLNMPARRSQKLSDKITTLQKLVSPYGKTDTASVLQEASLYIKLLQEQIQMLSSSYRSLRAIHPQHQHSFLPKSYHDSPCPTVWHAFYITNNAWQHTIEQYRPPLGQSL
ncbi:hypothetical protein V6N12_014824 [Hibiscus sabdariffa]|uniref:BHLH domain-containing protein n=1 Tax=Hibiscus sabdariffa TaxID=183260 RepID=A0ABR2DLC0_9ROSI